MSRYEELNFYNLELTNNSYAMWSTHLSFNESKKLIGTEDFIKISVYGSETEEREINTKAILYIKDITEIERKSLKRQEENFIKRLHLVNEIRKHKLPFSIRWKLKHGYHFELWEDKVFAKESGIELDPLMRYSDYYLSKMLKNCKQKLPQYI